MMNTIQSIVEKYGLTKPVVISDKETKNPLIHADGTTEWRQYGKLHREDGPAIERPNGAKEWYSHGILHRVDGPALISPEYKAWYTNGIIHRISGPAYESSDGTFKWYRMGNLHRSDGPAIERKSSINGISIREWWWDGKHSTEPEVKWLAMDASFINNPPQIGTALTHLYTDKASGKVHRADGPARIWANGMTEWYFNGQRHRLDGPAVVLPNGEEHYYLYGKLLYKAEHNIRVKSYKNTLMENTTTTVLASSSTESSPIPATNIEVPPVKAMVAIDSWNEEISQTEEKNKIRQWPEDLSELIQYDVIFTPLKSILEKGYTLSRKQEWKFDYNGYDIGKQEKKMFPAIKEQITEKYLKKEKEKNGRSLMDVVMRVMFLMGIEQGRRTAYVEQEPVRSLEKTLANYRARNKNVRYQLAVANATLKVREENPLLPKEELQKLINIELEKTRQVRIDEIKQEIAMDPTLTCFKLKTKKKTKLTDLLSLANTLDPEIFKMPDWISLLEEANCSPTEWKIFCKKNKFNKFLV